VKRWGAQLPPERIHVITVPRPGSAPELLWKRFATTVGLDADGYESGVEEAANQALGVIEANLLRRMNPVLAAELDWPTYQRWVTRFLTKSIFAARDELIPVALPPSEYEWVLERSLQFVSDLRDAGYDVVGDLEETVPVLPADDGEFRHPDDASDAEQLDAAVHAMVGLIRRFGMKSPPVRPTQAALPEEPMTLFRLGVQQLSRRHPSVMRLRQVYRLGKLGVARLQGRARR
jgi:hypothetical protein